jgi:hypothetical protein
MGKKEEEEDDDDEDEGNLFVFSSSLTYDISVF